MKILPKSNLPFTTETAAKIFASRKGISDYKVNAIEGGFEIEVGEKIVIKTDGGTSSNSAVIVKEDIAEQPKKMKRGSPTPWKPAQVIDIPEKLKDPNYVYRACRKGNINISKKLREGWEIDNELSKHMNPVPNYGQNSIHTGTALDSTTQIMDTIIMRLPRERKIARDKYLRDIQTTPAQLKQNINSKIHELTQGKVATYGDISVTQEEVLESEN